MKQIVSIDFYQNKHLDWMELQPISVALNYKLLNNHNSKLIPIQGLLCERNFGRTTGLEY